MSKSGIEATHCTFIHDRNVVKQLHCITCSSTRVITHDQDAKNYHPIFVNQRKCLKTNCAATTLCNKLCTMTKVCWKYVFNALLVDRAVKNDEFIKEISMNYVEHLYQHKATIDGLFKANTFINLNKDVYLGFQSAPMWESLRRPCLEVDNAIWLRLHRPQYH